MGTVTGGAVSGSEEIPPPAASPSRRRTRMLWLAALFAGLLISRWVLFPHYLITFDEINFALSVDQFNPRLHQPQPPGYPMFVALLKLVSFCTSNIEATFLLTALLVSGIALLLLWRLCDRITNDELGIFGALFLLFNPAFWLGSLTNPVRLCFAAGAVAVALCAWEACARKSSRWLALGAAALGIAAGARPALALLMTPLMLWAAWKIRLRWKAAIAILFCFGAAVATWLPALIAASGGYREFLAMLNGYSHHQMSGTSLLYGATLREAWRMAWEAVSWSCLGALSWAWALPIVARQRKLTIDPFTRHFLALWFFPGLAFYAVFHVGDPDHTLAIVPVTCVAGLLVIAALTRNLPRVKRWTVFFVCVFLNIFLFFKPITKTTKPSTYTPVKWMSDYIADVIEGTRNLEGHGPVAAIFEEANNGWRQLSYYDPAVRILVLMRGPGGRLGTRWIWRRDATEAPANGSVALSACGVLAWIDPQGPPAASKGVTMQSTRARVYFTRAAPGEFFEYHGTHFSTSQTLCGATP